MLKNFLDFWINHENEGEFIEELLDFMDVKYSFSDAIFVSQVEQLACEP